MRRACVIVVLASTWLCGQACPARATTIVGAKASGTTVPGTTVPGTTAPEPAPAQTAHLTLEPSFAPAAPAATASGEGTYFNTPGCRGSEGSCMIKQTAASIVGARQAEQVVEARPGLVGPFAKNAQGELKPFAPPGATPPTGDVQVYRVIPVRSVLSTPTPTPAAAAPSPSATAQPLATSLFGASAAGGSAGVLNRVNLKRAQP